MRVALLGFGRFGRALSSLLEEIQAHVRVFDPHAEVPAPLHAPSLPELVAEADYVVVAVPVPAMKGAMRALRPHVHPEQLVLDVGSVKVHPTEALAEVFGSDIPWIGTHPLFGPASLAAAERPLRVVVCPNLVHPSATARAHAFYEQIGCEIIEQDAETHDKIMAKTHALTFFVAKGMLDAGAAKDVVFAPPSFQAIARTIDVVRADAGHLFSAIQRENPFSADARQQLLEALTLVDRALARPDETREADAPPSLAIPDLGAQLPELREARDHIDEVDRAILALLERRAELAHRAAAAKESLGHGVFDPPREAAIIQSRRAWAADAGLDPDSVDDVFQAILRFSRRLQRRRPSNQPGL